MNRIEDKPKKCIDSSASTVTEILQWHSTVKTIARRISNYVILKITVHYIGTVNRDCFKRKKRIPASHGQKKNQQKTDAPGFRRLQII